MGDTFKIEVKQGRREWSRTFYSALVKNLAKTITEPITNSDTAYKRKFDLPHATGLVELALSLNKGTRFDLSEEKKKLSNPTVQREMQIHIYTTRPRKCEIVDFAEGLDINQLKAAFEFYAEDKSSVSKNRPGRSLFGRGVSDVLFGHKEGNFYAYKDGILSQLTFKLPTDTHGQPQVIGKQIGKPSDEQLRQLHLRPGENGCCVSFVLHEDCRIHEEGNIVQILSQFYMLRLINADPNIQLKLFRHRSGGKVYESELTYDFPIGNVIDKFSFEITNPVKDAKLDPLVIDAIICRSDLENGLPGREAGDQRANGLLFVDDEDAVLDLTFLPRFDEAPFLRNIYGIIRIKNIRAVMEWYLNKGKDSPLTVSRDGFDIKHDFTKKLFDELSKRLEPIYKREEEKFNKEHTGNLSSESREKLDEAIKELNKLLKDLAGEGDGTKEDTEIKLDPTKAIQFFPSSIRLVVGKPRYVRVYYKQELATQKGCILIESSNPKIEISPVSQLLEEGSKENGYLKYVIRLKSDNLNENAIITALADGIDQTNEANLEIIDVVDSSLPTPPEEMEFRPRTSKGEPNKENNLVLLINAKAIPLERQIKVELEKSHGNIGFLVGEKREQKTTIRFDKSHLIRGTDIGRIVIPWRGTGWGQEATVLATTKKPDGSLAIAKGKIALEEPETAGIIRDVKYDELENQSASQFVDGIIYINSKHAMNKFVLGTQQQYPQRIAEDRTAQYRLALIMVEQSVFTLAENNFIDDKLALNDRAPVTSLREFIDVKTNYYAPKLFSVLVTK